MTEFKHGGRRQIKRFIGWGFSIAGMGIIAWIGYHGMVTDKLPIYIHNRIITASTTLMAYYTPLILFNYCMGDPLNEILSRHGKEENVAWQDRLSATLFMIALALSSAYLISIGA